MRSLVVFLSAMALAAASPSGILSYGAVVGVAPSAVSHQSRVDIKSTPTVVETEVVQPIARTVVAQPAIVASAPASYVATPLTYTAPLAYSAPAALAVAPAAVSQQSRVEIQSTPTVVSSVATAPFFRAVIPGSPISYASPIGIPAIFGSAGIAPVAIAGAAPAIVKSAEIPTEISAELPVAPSETPEVAAARAAHLEAKAEIEEAHKIQKRSVLLPAPVITSYAAPTITKFASTPIIYSGAHLPTYSAPIVRYY